MPVSLQDFVFCKDAQCKAVPDFLLFLSQLPPGDACFHAEATQKRVIGVHMSKKGYKLCNPESLYSD